MSRRCRSSSTAAPGITKKSRPTFSMSLPRSWCPPQQTAQLESWALSTKAPSPRRGTRAPESPGSTTVAWARKNCQVGVFLTAVTPGGTALLAHQLYLPKPWCEQNNAGKKRRDAAHVPSGIAFRTKPEIGADLVRTVAVLDTVRLDWVVADELYGRNGQFLDEMEKLGHNYLVEVP